MHYVPPQILPLLSDAVRQQYELLMKKLQELGKAQAGLAKSRLALKDQMSNNFSAAGLETMRKMSGEQAGLLQDEVHVRNELAKWFPSYQAAVSALGVKARESETAAIVNVKGSLGSLGYQHFLGERPEGMDGIHFMRVQPRRGI